MENNYGAFDALDIGTAQPISVPAELVEVEVGVDDLIGKYAKAFVNEAYRVNPLRAEQVGLTEDEVDAYCRYLLVQRVNTVHMDCPMFRKLKVLYIPSYVQYTLAMIGRVDIREKGLQLIPVAQDGPTITYEEAVAISEKIGSFINDLQIVQDAMPRDIHGNKDVMSCALCGGYVRSIEKVEHVSATYVAAYLGMKLRREVAFQALYRVQYDDVEFIASALTAHKGLF